MYESKSVPTVLIIQGLRDHVAGHWQTLLAFKLAKTRPVHVVAPLGREDLSCARRVAAIRIALDCISGPVTFVAHSAGVITLAHWAQHHRRADVAGAVLAAPADLDKPLPAGYPAFDDLKDNGWLPIPREALPFPSIVAASSNDPLASLESVECMARDWGSECVHVGAVGHLNPNAGFGEWQQAQTLIERFDPR